MQNKFDLSVKTITKNNIKYSWAFVLLLIPVTSYADFSFANYPYTLTNLHNLLITDHQINTFSNYTINFTPVQTSGIITTYEHRNPDSWVPISYTYTVAPNSGVVESTNITMTSNNQNITGYFHNMISSDINGASGVLNNLGTIAGDFVGNHQTSQAGALSNNIWIHNLYGDFIDNSSNNDAGALRNAGNIFRVQSNFIGNETTNHSGGAILNDGTVDYITGNFIHNTAHYMGGAIYNSGSINNLTGSFIDNSTYSGPGVYGDGGAISNTGTFTLSDSLFMNNSSYSGGAIASMGYGFNISDSQFIENSATDGGAIWNSDTATFNVNNEYSNMVFTFNQAARDGGAMYIANTGQTTLNASNHSNISFTHNQADRYGGAVYNAGTMVFNTTNGYITFSDNEIMDNNGNGSAIYNAGTMTLTSNNYGGITFSNNGNGGAIYNTGTLTLNADNGNIGYIVFDNNSDYAITTSGTLNFTGNTRAKFLTDSDDIILLNDAVTNINSASYVDAQDINGNGTINNSGRLVIQGHIGADILINNTGSLTLPATDVSGNITISGYGALELTDGTLNYTPHYNGSLHISGNVISNVPIEQQEIIGYAGSSLHISADNIISDISVNGTTNIYLTSGTLNNNISGIGTIITASDVSGGANNFRETTVNDYNLTLSSGTLIANITGNGNIITGGNILSNADNLGNNVTNDYVLTLSDGTISKNITGDGTIIVDGAVVVNDIANVAQNITINEDKQLSISANNINSSIIDNGTLNLTGGILISTNITGDGDILITGDVTSNVDINQSLQIAQNASLSINADNILNTISNNGTVALSGGTLNQQIAGNINIIGDVYTSASNLASDNITNNSNNLTLTGGVLAHSILGTGNTIINGNVTVSEPLSNTSVSIANDITINSNAELHSHASAIQNNVQNNGELYLTGGTIEYNISGGNTIIDGIVNNNALLSTSTIINADKSLSTSANSIGGTINNEGTLTLTGGTLNYQITGNGVINITDYTYTSADNLLGSGNIWNTSNLELTGGTLQQVISGNGNTLINGNVQSSASNLYGNITINDEKTLTLTGGTLHSTVSGDGAIAVAGNVEIDTDIYNDVSINSGAELHIIAGAIKNDIQNDGSLYITSSVGRNTIEHDITGGATIIEGSTNNIAVINNALLNTAITINSDKTLVSSADGIGGTVNNNGYLVLSGGTITHNITGNGQTGISGAVTNNVIISQDITVYSGDSLTTSADGICADVSNYGNIILTGGILNHNITGGAVTIDGDVENNVSFAGNTVVINDSKSLTTSADNIAYLSNNGTLSIYPLYNYGTLYLNGGTLSRGVNGNVYITGNVTNNTYQSEQINISDGGTFTTSANLLTNNNAISNDGTLNITGGNLQQNVTGGNTIIAQNATTSATSFGNLELNGVMNVGTNTVNMANADINGTINLGISALNKNSNLYTGGHIVADDITFGDNAKLSLTITDTNLQKGDSSGDLSIITANGTWTGDFDVLTSNNLYDITYNDNSHTFTFARKKFGADLITELNGTELDVNVATVWDELQSSNNQNVQSIINAIDYNSQHNAKKYATLIHNLAPHNNQVTVGAIRNVNTAINNRVTARLATTRTSPVTNNNLNRQQNRYNRNPYYYMGYQGRNGGDVTPATNNGLWVEGLYNYAQQKDDTKFSGKTYGVTGGFDSKLTEHLTAGLGYAFNKITIDADNHDIDATGHTGFVYAEYKPTQWYLDALLSYNMTNYQDSSALVDNLSVNSDYKTNSFGGSVISGYDFQKGYDLYGGLNYIGIKQDAYTDTAGQYVKADDTQTLTLTAGGKYRMTSQNMKKASTILKAAVLYDVMSDDGVTTVTVGNNNYIVRGDGIDPFGVQAGIMFDALGNNANLSIGYDLEWRNNFISHTGYIKLKYNF